MRLDVAFAVTKLLQFMHYHEYHWFARVLPSTRDQGIFLLRNNLNLHAFSYADWTGNSTGIHFFEYQKVWS